MISEEELVVGCIYEVAGINLSLGIWTGEVFRGPQNTYGSLKFVEERPYWEPLPLGTCTPIRIVSAHKLTPPYDGVNLLKSMDTLDSILQKR